MVAHPWIVATIITVLAFVAVIFLPLPGYYNVSVTVGTQEISLLLVNDFSITGVSGQTTGQSTILDLGTLLSLAPPALQATFTETVCVAGHCASRDASSWFTTVPVINGGHLESTNTFAIGYVPATCDATISVTLSQSGSTVATGSATMNVGSNC